MSLPQPGLPADDLSGVRLVARADLLAMLEGLMAGPPGASGVGPSQTVSAIHLAAAKAEPPPRISGGQAAAESRRGADAGAVRKFPSGDEQFLTADELARLLENEP